VFCRLRILWPRSLGGVGRAWFANSAKTKETGAIPFRAGNGLRDDRETRIRRITPQEAFLHDGDRMPLTIIFTNEDSARLEVTIHFIGPLAPGQPIKQLYGFPVEAAESFLLDPISDHPAHDVLGETLGRNSAEHHTPTCAKRVDAEGPNLVDLGIDRSGIYRPLIHGYAAWRSVACGFVFALIR
jgi:hypothetical protein